MGTKLKPSENLINLQTYQATKKGTDTIPSFYWSILKFYENIKIEVILDSGNPYQYQLLAVPGGSIN